MNVNDFDKYITSYLDGDLRPSEMKEFEDLLKNNLQCKQKFDNFKDMLGELSNLDTLRTSSDFLDKLHKKINKPPKVSFINKFREINFSGYDYVSITGIAAALIMFIFSISLFIQSESLPIVNLDELSTKNINNNSIIKNNDQLLSEEDSLNNREDRDLPIHLVGSKK